LMPFYQWKKGKPPLAKAGGGFLFVLVPSWRPDGQLPVSGERIGATDGKEFCTQVTALQQGKSQPGCRLNAWPREREVLDRSIRSRVRALKPCAFGMRRAGRSAPLPTERLM